ncbi:MAG TPA: methylamine utilization protein MauJ [Candidatus Eremiobacteraceae bacterium]|nr:methylamine utilization protein MauJ [Candidatus Eremiobacteraceae bacterium]
MFRAEDGAYYYNRSDGILVKVIGGKTTEETRLDFITGQLIHSHGFLHRFLALFALFAITDDYLSSPDSYPRSMKAVVPSMDFYHISHQWHFMFFDRTRSFVWRPNSNLCDTAWLVGDVLASITETLEIDFWRKRVESRRPDSAWIESDCPYQSDWVVDSSIRLGPEEEVFLTFEGKRFRWFNGTVEKDAVVSMGVRNLRDHSEEEARLNRLLSALVWDQKMPVRKLWGSGGPRRPHPTVFGPRQAGGMGVDAAHIQYSLAAPRTTTQWFALALHKEAVNSRSRFYSFLCFWKIIDLAYPKLKARREWMNDVAAKKTMEKERVSEILKNTTDLERHLREERRNAIEHVFKQNTINPDDPKHEAKVSHDLRVIESFARIAMSEMLGDQWMPRV